MGSYKKVISGAQKLGDIAINIFNTQKLVYIIEKGWSIEWDGKQITNSLNRQKLISSRISLSDDFLKNKIVHYGSINTFMSEDGVKNKKCKRRNKVIVTWFHIPSDDARIKYIPLLNKYSDIVHTSCELTKKKLIKYGLKKEKVVVIPLGVDLSIFKSKTKSEKRQTKKKLGLPENKIVIGSFQKDGVGWGEGLEPKLVKGPDIFLKVVKKLAKKYPIYVLLTGPARGYVKKGLEKMRIPFMHRFLKNYLDIAEYYNALDLYLVTSREEGGPKAILESMACGIPLITTKVGIASDIIRDRKNGMMTDIENTGDLVKKSVLVLENKNLEKKIVINALEDIEKYSWNNIARQYYQKIYKKLL